MRKETTAVIVLGALMVAGAALAQTPGPSVEPPSSRGIIPVTGPSTVPAFPEAPKSELVQEKVTTAQDPRKGAAGRRAVSTAAPVAPRSVKAVKSAQKPQATTAVKTPSATTHAAKAGTPRKTRQVATVTHRPPAHHATVGKPIPVTKRQPPAKGAAPAQPVLPRV